ncbi:DUF2255 family protein [Chryseobacterium jejuense]|uniref:Uncharacterized protein conserved in bacteria (DUF2255) n=1 Tax=Chryseobacterium jejuense TaxID=445960 RepID=A0A2X2VPA2_CHRJE|nr:DUF2255 family protein [Chryseobacterium jejuense]SDI40756.1 hypothetical protein SAMN05421542_1123 [Chryseobacterium jejuense]SQB26983.1 Uncharacterized protein conserved in bacteria (DUF2255) [Chryseobacterium jejuense]
MDKNKALDYIRTHNLIGIKAGSERPEFLEIWMVVAQNRIFARSWGLAEKSWYNTFLKCSEGQIKCGNVIYNVQAVIPEDLNQLTDEINQVYLTKYNSEHNRKYAVGIIEDKHIEKTMEFVIREVE